MRSLVGALMKTHQVTLAIALAFPAAGAIAQDEARASTFGEYAGYSEEKVDEWVNHSAYVEMSDGVRLAVDITRPSVDGVAVDAPYPVVWTHSRYHRNLFAMGARGSNVDVNPALQRLVRHGYVVCAAAVRGSGASYGRCGGLFSARETEDAVELIEWFAAQEWCDGNVGMYGGSYLGITQYMAAAHEPPALKAIFPDVAAFDMYDLVYPGGVFRRDTFQHWSDLTVMLDTQLGPQPVDADEDGARLKEALAGHADNWDVMDGYSSAPYRDSVSKLHDWSNHGPSVLLDDINAAKIPAYHINGWFDVFTLDATLWFANYDGPQRLTMGAWSHSDFSGQRAAVTSAEQHRWFDRWLKGIDNGVDTEPPVRFALMREPGDWEWVAAETWPLPGTETLSLAFGDGPIGSVASVNDGALTPTTGSAGRDAYTVDPTTTTGAQSRWDNAVGQGAMSYGDMSPNDEKSLTYTTPVLAEDLTVVGHPVVLLHLTSSRGDADLHVLLEEVGEDGIARYVTEGVLRASLRKLSRPRYDNLGLPFQMCLAGDAEPVPADEPVAVVMDLHPTATVFDAGHRLRVTIMGADQDNTDPSPFVDDTVLHLHHGDGTPSSIELPVLR